MSQEKTNSSSPQDVPSNNGNGRTAPTILQSGADFIQGRLLPPPPSFGLTHYIQSFRRKCVLALGLGIICGSLAGGLSWYFRPHQQYSAAAYLQISSNEDQLLFPAVDTNSNFDIYKRTQKQLLLNPYVLLAALRDEEINQLNFIKKLQQQGLNEEIEWLRNELQVTFPDDSEIMEVKLVADDKKAVELLVNEIVNVYMKEVVDKEENAKQERADKLISLHDDKQRELGQARLELKNYAKNQGGSDPEVISLAQQNKLREFATFFNELTNVEFELMRAEGELEIKHSSQEPMHEKIPILLLLPTKSGPLVLPPSIEKIDEIELSDVELELALTSDPILAELEDESKRLTNRIDITRTTLDARAAESILMSYESRKEKNEEKIESRRKSIRQNLIQLKKRQVDSELKLKEEQADSELKTLKKRVAVLKNQRDKLQKEVNRLRNETEQFGGTSVDVDIMKAEIAALESVISRISSEIEETNVELRANPRIKRLVDDRDNPDQLTARRVQSSSPYVISGLAALIGLLLPVIGIVWIDSRKRHLNFSSEIAHSLRLNVLGSVPLIPSRHLRRLNRPSKQRNYWKRILSESSDAIAATLLHWTESHTQQIVLVSSASEGEGKTTLSKQLATSLASTGRKMLLLDFDLRRPELHNIFSVDLGPGVCELLQNQASLEAALQQTDIENLWVIPAGAASFNGFNRLSQSNIKSVFESLRKKFDFVIVDSSPILPAVETRLIGKHVDGVILSVLRDVSQSPKLQAACEILETFDIPLIGAVMTGSGHEIYYPMLN